MIAHPAAEQLPHRHAQASALHVPQRLIEAGQCRHQHRSTAVETAAVADLPDVLDARRVRADETVAEGFEGAVDGFGVAFETGLAPTHGAVVRFHPHEQPARWHLEGLDARNPATHGTASSRLGRRTSSDMTPARQNDTAHTLKAVV